MPVDAPVKPGEAAHAAHRATKGYCERYSSKLLTMVSDPGCALKLTVCALIISAALYLVLHWLITSTPVDFSKAVAISADGRFRCYYRDDILDRFFSREKVNEWKQRMDEKAVAFSQDALVGRQALLVPLQHFVQSTFSERMALVGSWSGSNSESNLVSLTLPWLQGWLQRQRDSLQPASRFLIDDFIQRIEVQNGHEIMLRNRLLAEVAGLQSSLSFDWFFIDSWKWIIEVFFWCTFGVLANTFISLIFATREGRYEAKEFLLVIPKAALAPVLAIVIISWWATGMSESKITFANLPYFLVLSFSLGFVTESLYVKIKELGNLIVGPSATASAAKMEAAARREPYRFLHPDVRLSELPPASNLESLREQLRAAAKAAMERGLVAQLSDTGKTSS